MIKKNFTDINDEMDWKQFVNDCSYPWDEAFTMSAAEMDEIKRSLIYEMASSKDTLINSYRY